MRKPLACRVSAKALVFLIICCAYSLKAGDKASFKATALPAIEAANSKINTFITRTSTTIATVGLSLAEGVGKPGEALVDVGAIVVTAIASLPTLLIDAGSDIYFKLIGNDLDSLTNKMLEATKSFVVTSIRKVQNNPLFFPIAKLGLYYKQCW